MIVVLFLDLFLLLAGIYYVTIVLNYLGIPIFVADIELGNALKPFYYWVYGWEKPEVIVKAKKDSEDKPADKPKIENLK